MGGPYNRDKLTRDLRDLGVNPGDTLFIHSSYKSLGPVVGEVQTVIDSLRDAVGPAGLILMPSFNLVERPRRAKVWNVATTPSTVGWITEYFRRLPGTNRSDHYSHSVAAKGAGAMHFVSSHLSQEGYASKWDLKPWGKTFGSNSPMYRAYESEGKLLMLGVDYESSTYVHMMESMHWARLREEDPEADFPRLDRLLLGAFWDSTGHASIGMVGDAECRLFRIREYVDTLLGIAQKDPKWTLMT